MFIHLLFCMTDEKSSITTWTSFLLHLRHGWLQLYHSLFSHLQPPVRSSSEMEASGQSFPIESPRDLCSADYFGSFNSSPSDGCRLSMGMLYFQMTVKTCITEKDHSTQCVRTYVWCFIGLSCTFPRLTLSVHTSNPFSNTNHLTSPWMLFALLLFVIVSSTY